MSSLSMPPPSPEPRLPLVTARTVSATWAAQYLNLSVDSIYRLIEEGKLKAYRHNGRGWHKILSSSVLQYEAGIRNQLM